jgi:hypothetical protein
MLDRKTQCMLYWENIDWLMDGITYCLGSQLA